jgi:hypothetical protein
MLWGGGEDIVSIGADVNRWSAPFEFATRGIGGAPANVCTDTPESRTRPEPDPFRTNIHQRPLCAESDIARVD